MIILKSIPILNNNYVWMIYDINRFCIIIDPGESKPILKIIRKNKFNPIAILLTHNHIDHVGGISGIINEYPKIIVFGPSETKEYGATKIVSQGDKIYLLNQIFYVLFTPGHTSGHVSYYIKPYVFCGDTLFSGGCGRVYKKMYLEMYKSIKIISSLPNGTMLCCSHEYTISNLMFSISILPYDKFIKMYYENIKIKIKLNKTSLPSCLFHERKFNLFLRTDENILKSSLGLGCNIHSFECFIKLRLKKDVF